MNSSTTTLPSLFVSHGAPTLAIEEGPAHLFLGECGRKLGKPEAVLMLSAHYDETTATVTNGAQPATIHDFGGFPEPLYQINYPAPGRPELARRVVEMLLAHDIPAQADPVRGFDHGAWVPMSLMYPNADVPLVQLSIDSRKGPAYHYHLGGVLRPLRDEGVLIVGSGGATHNLGVFFSAGREDPTPTWVSEFSDWLYDSVVNGRRDDLINYRSIAPYAARNHPSEEHYLPLLTAAGAADSSERSLRVHTSNTYSALMMDAYLFGADAALAARFS